MTAASEMPEETALYRIFGEAELLLYIGISKNFGQRWKKEAQDFPWWNERRRMTIEMYDFRSVAEAAEEAAIKAEKPKYNKRHLVLPERASRRPAAVMPPPSPALAVVAAEPPSPPCRQDSGSCKVPYPYSLLSFTLPGHSMDGIDLSTPDGRFRAAEAFSAYEKQALEFRSFLEKTAAGALEMERNPDLQWAAPALRKLQRNCRTLIGDGSSVAVVGELPVAGILREGERLSLMLAEAMGVIADALDAVVAVNAEDEAA